jgi:hypothetical protein
VALIYTLVNDDNEDVETCISHIDFEWEDRKLLTDI